MATKKKKLTKREVFKLQKTLDGQIEELKTQIESFNKFTEEESIREIHFKTNNHHACFPIRDEEFNSKIVKLYKAKMKKDIEALEKKFEAL